MHRFLLSSVAILSLLSPVHAGQSAAVGGAVPAASNHKPRGEQPQPHLEIAIRDGRVWLSSDGASLSEILVAYGRIGGTEVVNAEGLATDPVTIELAGVRERQALDLLLRRSGGFVVVPKPNAGLETGTTVSEFARILIVPGGITAGPATGAVALPAPNAISEEAVSSTGSVEIAPGVHRLIGPDGQPVADDQDDVPAIGNVPAQAVPATVPPGASQPPQTPPSAQQPSAAPAMTPTAPSGVARPGMVPPAPSPSETPVQTVRRPGSGPQRH